MATITASGMGSGLDINGLVQQLVEAEAQAPVNRLNRREAQTQSEISALGLFKSALSDFSGKVSTLMDADTFRTRSATSSNEDLFSVSAGSTAVAGSYAIEVEQLAQAHKAISQGFADADTDIGTGTLTLTVDGTATDIVIDENNQTLAGIRDAINGSDAGVTAAIVHVDDGADGTESKLVLTAEKSGTANEFSVSVEEGDGAGLTRLISINLATNLVQEAQDAVLKVDGQTVTRSSNSIGDVIDGITIDLEQAEPGTVETLTVALDENKVRQQVEGFVKSFNALVTTLNQLTGYNPDTQQAGALNGDAAVRTVRSQLYQEISRVVEAVEGGYGTLAGIGITTKKDGTLELDGEKLGDALTADFDQLGTLFADETDGIAVRLDNLLSGYVGSDGVIDSRVGGLKDRLNGIADDRERLQLRLEKIEQRYLAQFIAMDALVGQLQNTGNYLAQQLANLPGARDTSGGS